MDLRSFLSFSLTHSAFQGEEDSGDEGESSSGDEADDLPLIQLGELIDDLRIKDDDGEIAATAGAGAGAATAAAASAGGPPASDAVEELTAKMEMAGQ